MNWRYSAATHTDDANAGAPLSDARISSSYRNSFGATIDAACGQLFAGYPEKPAAAPRRSSRQLAAPRRCAVQEGSMRGS